MPGGRPSKLNAERTAKVCEAVELGMTYKLACQYANMGETTFYRWMEKGAVAPHGKYREFWKAVKAAEAQCVHNDLSTISTAARDGNWTAAAWRLERRHGYTKPVHITSENTTTIVNTGPNVANLTTEELRDLATWDDDEEEQEEPARKTG